MPSDLLTSLPENALKESLSDTLRKYGPTCPLFFIETALDRGYLLELLAVISRLKSTEHQLLLPIAQQEADMFLLALVLRGKHLYALDEQYLLPLYIEGAQITRQRYAAMLASRGALEAAAFAVGRAIDGLSTDSPAMENQAGLPARSFESLAWKRYLRLARRLLAADPTGIGCVTGYAASRRVEISNLITISEGIRARLEPEAIRNRLIT